MHTLRILYQKYTLHHNQPLHVKRLPNLTTTPSTVLLLLPLIFLYYLLGLNIQVSTEKQRCVSMKSWKQASGSSNEMYRHLVLEMYRHLVLWHSLSYLYRIFSFGQGNLAHVAFFRVLG